MLHEMTQLRNLPYFWNTKNFSPQLFFDKCKILASYVRSEFTLLCTTTCYVLSIYISLCYSCVFIMYTSGNKRRRGKDKIAKVALYVSSCLPRPYSPYVPWVHTLESSNHVFCMEMVSKIHTRPDQLHVGKVCID